MGAVESFVGMSEILTVHGDMIAVSTNLNLLSSRTSVLPEFTGPQLFVLDPSSVSFKMYCAK
jgi:hypothetical protein